MLEMASEEEALIPRVLEKSPDDLWLGHLLSFWGDWTVWILMPPPQWEHTSLKPFKSHPKPR
jgi:hypothetical protein